MLRLITSFGDNNFTFGLDSERLLEPKMAEGELRKIKLISLDVIEFKTLSRGKLSLKHEDGKSFSVINVKNFDGE